MPTQQLIVEKNFFEMGDLSEAVDLWLNGVGREDALLIYVHGKGREEPTKTLELLDSLIDWYGVRPLVLHWRPCGGVWPDGGAKAAGLGLVRLLENLKLRARPTKPIVVLGQSMGNFAIQHVGECVEWQSPPARQDAQDSRVECGSS